MKVLVQKCFAIVALFAMAYLLLNAFQYRNSEVALGTVTHVGGKICLHYKDEGSHIGCDRTAVKMKYIDGEFEREVDIKYGTSSRHAQYHRLLPPAAVGAQANVVYVPGRPWMTRLAVNHIYGWGIAWLATFLAFCAWVAWRGDKHPLVVWINSRRDR